MSITPGGLIQGSRSLKSARIGAGGWATGLTIANDGKVMIRTDTTPAFTLASSSAQWQRTLVPGVTCNASDLDIFYGGDPHPWGLVSCYDSAIAPSNSNVQYQICMGYVWITQNGNAATPTWTRTALAQKPNASSAEPARMTGKPLAVDPQNPAHVIAGFPSGAFRSVDYGANWTTISTATVPAPTAGTRMCVAFDPSSAVTLGIKQGVYIFSQGSGLRKSTDGGATFTTPTQPATTPTLASHLKVGANGYVYLTGGRVDLDWAGQFRRWNGTTWLEPTGMLCKTIAISPHNPGHIYAGGAGGGLAVSLNYGDTWSPDNTNAPAGLRQATTIPWHAWTAETYMSNGDYAFDPILNRLWCAEGIGVWYLDNPPTTLTFATNQYTWIECSNGLESLVTSLVTVNDVGDVGYSCHDRGVFVVPREEIGRVSPSQHGGDLHFQHGCDVEPIPGNDNAWAAAVTLQRDPPSLSTCYTSNRGASWSADDSFKTANGGLGGGNLVCFDANNWLQVSINRGHPLAGQSNINGIWRTSNASAGAAATWTKCTIGTNEALWLYNGFGDTRKILVRDAFAAAGTAYVYNIGDGFGSADDIACRGIWKTTNYGVTWTRVKSSFITNHGADAYRAQFKQIGTDDWLYSGGDECLGLWRSTNGMVTWTQLTGTDDVNGAASFAEVACCAVGKNHPNSAFKTIAAMGWRMVSPTGASNATGWGFWVSIDNGATWTRWDQYPGGFFDYPQTLAADPIKYGRFYIGWGGGGLYFYDINDVRTVS